MAEEDLPEAVIKTLYGWYGWAVMPIGFINAPATLQKQMQYVLGEFLTIFYAFYLDDISLFEGVIRFLKRGVDLIIQLLRRFSIEFASEK